MPLRISLARQFEQQQSETLQLAFSQNGNQLISSDGRALYLWQLQEGGNWTYERSLPVRGAGILRFASDIVFYVEEGLLKLISFEGQEKATFPHPSSRFWAISPDLRWLVSSDSARHLLLWDLVSRQSFSIPIPFPPSEQWKKGTHVSDEPVLRFLFTPDSRQVVLFADGVEGSLHICSFDPEHGHIRLQKTLRGMIDGAISPDGKMLAIILSNDQVFNYKEDIYLYNLESLDLLHVFPQTTHERPCLLAFSPDSQWLASAKSEGSVDLFSVETWACETQFAAHPGLSSHATDPVGGLDWSTTGYIATGGASVLERDMDKTDYTIKIWRVDEV